MKIFLSIIVVLFVFSCSKAQIQPAENGMNQMNTPLTADQIRLVYEKTKDFPNNTQLSIAVIENGEVTFVGIKRLNDTIQPIENRNKVFEIGSVSKVFTAVLLANFVMNGEIALND